MSGTSHGARAHAKYSGSNVHRFRRCPGQARLAKALGRSWGDTTHSEEGTTVHELIEIALSKGLTAAQDDVRWTDDRAKSLWWVLEYVTSLRAAHPDLVLLLEHPVCFPQSVVPPSDACGLADIVAFSPAARRAWLVDYKNGVVGVEDPATNEQLWFYATAAFWESNLDRITLAIIQPNGLGVAPVREADISPLELVAFQADLERVIAACEAHDAPLTPGDWCGGCSVGAECNARERDAIKAMTGHEGTYLSLTVEELPAPEALDVARWAAIRRKAGFVRKWLADIDAAAMSYAMRGGDVPGEKLVEASARRYFLGAPEVTAKGLSELTGRPPEFFLKTEVVGITEAEKHVSEAARKSPDPAALTRRFAALTDKKSSGNLSLVPEDDKRPAYNKATSTFVGVVAANLVGS